MFCTKCGNKLMDGALFCTKCGTRIAQPKSVSDSKKFENTVPESVMPRPDEDATVMLGQNDEDATVLLSQNDDKTEYIMPGQIPVGFYAESENMQPATVPQIRYEEPNQKSAKAEKSKKEKPQKVKQPKEKKSQKSKKKKSGSGLLIAAIIMVLLLIFAAVIFILIGLSSESDLFGSGFFGKESSKVESREEDEEEDTDEEETTEETSEEATETTEAAPAVDMESVLADIQSKVSAGEYQEALALIGDTKMSYGDNENLYLYEADVYLKQKDYLSAMEALEEGIAVTSSDTLVNRKQYISKNIVLVEATPQDGSAGFFHEYNANGNLVREEIYNSAYEPGGWNEYTYDSTGAITVRNTYNSKGNLEKRSEYRYDSSGALEMIVDYNSKHVRQGWHEYVYDSLGREIEVIDHINEKKIGWKTVTEYDSYGRLFRNTGYDGKNKVSGWVETKYDGNDNVIMMVRYDSKGKTVEWNETKYDTNGNPTEFISYAKNDTVVSSTRYEYDANGKKLKETYYDKDGIEVGYAEFDAAGKKKIEQNKETGVIWDYRYQYIGDVLSDNGMTPVTGTLSFYAKVGYKRIPAQGAAYMGYVSKNDIYQVVAESAEYYRVAEGWYFSKKDSGITFTQR